MEQKHVLLSALSVGVGLGVGLGLSSGQTVQKWIGANREPGEVTGEQIELELMRQVVDGKDSKVTFDEFPYFLRVIYKQYQRFWAYSHLLKLKSRLVKGFVGMDLFEVDLLNFMGICYDSFGADKYLMELAPNLS